MGKAHVHSILSLSLSLHLYSVFSSYHDDGLLEGESGPGHSEGNDAGLQCWRAHQGRAPRNHVLPAWLYREACRRAWRWHWVSIKNIYFGHKFINLSQEICIALAGGGGGGRGVFKLTYLICILKYEMHTCLIVRHHTLCVCVCADVSHVKLHQKQRVLWQWTSCKTSSRKMNSRTNTLATLNFCVRTWRNWQGKRKGKLVWMITRCLTLAKHHYVEDYRGRRHSFTLEELEKCWCIIYHWNLVRNSHEDKILLHRQYVHRMCAVTAAVSLGISHTCNSQTALYIHHFGGYSKSHWVKLQSLIQSRIWLECRGSAYKQRMARYLYRCEALRAQLKMRHLTRLCSMYVLYACMYYWFI